MNNKVVHLVTPFLFHTGPWIYDIITGLRNYESFVFTQKKENADLFSFPQNKIYSAEDLNRFKFAVTKFYRPLTYRYGIFFSEYINNIKPALFHGHFGFESYRWLPLIKKHNLPLVTTFYGLDVSKLGVIPKWRRRYTELFEYGSFFLAEGGNLKRQLIELGCPEEKVRIQHLGIDISDYKFKSSYQSGDKFRILQVSTFREKKGIEYSLRAIKEITGRHPHIEYRLIGSGDDESAVTNIRSLINQLGIEKNVKLLGITTREEMKQEMLSCDLFLHPSVVAANGDNEGGAPVSLIEASASGMPVISSYHADIPEVVEDDVTGFLCKEKDFTGIAGKIMTLIESESLRQKFGRAGREHIQKNYDQRSMIAQLERIYDMAVER